MIDLLMPILAVGFSIVTLALTVSRLRWKEHAMKCQDTISEYESELQTERNAIRRLGEDLDVQKKNVDALIGDREALRIMYGTQLDLAESWRRKFAAAGESQLRLAGARQEIETLKAELAKVADDRFAEVAKRTKCELQLHTIGRERNEALLKCDSYLKANENLLQKLNEATDQLDAVRNAIAVRPEPVE